MELSGGNKSLEIVMSSPNVENLTGITAQQLSDSHEFDIEVHKDLQLELNGLDVVCSVKTYEKNSLGNLGTPSIRYSVVKAYALKAIPQAYPTTPSSVVPLPLPAKSQPSAATDDVQLFTPDTKDKVAEIEGMTPTEKTSHPSPSAKRNFQFVSPNKSSTPPGVATSTAGKSDDTSINSTDDNTLENTSVKKGREEDKLS